MRYALVALPSHLMNGSGIEITFVSLRGQAGRV